jgi:hypothetical protein
MSPLSPPLPLWGMFWQAEQVIAPLFRRLRAVAEYAAKEELRAPLPVPEAVVSVPCFFPEAQRVCVTA